jgi:hypothetical protein
MICFDSGFVKNSKFALELTWVKDIEILNFPLLNVLMTYLKFIQLFSPLFIK